MYIKGELIMTIKSKILLGACVSAFLSTVQAAGVTVWSWDIAADALKGVAKTYGKSIEVIDKGYDPVYEQVTAGCAAGGINLPDVVSLENSEAERYLQQFPNCFTALDPYGAKHLVNDFPAYKWKELYKDGNIYGIPWDSGQVVYFYRRDMFNKAGINASDIETWDDFISAGKKMRAATRGRVAMAMSSYASGDNYFSIISQQNGCNYFSEKNGKIVISVNQSGCVTALETVKKLVDSDTISSGGWDDKIQSIKANRVAGSVYGAWFEGSIRDAVPEQSGKWGVIKMPASKKGGRQAANLGGAALFVLKNSKNPQAAFDFIKYALATEGAQVSMLKNQGLVPSYLPALQSDYVNQGMEYWGNQDIWNLILSTSKDIIPFRGTKHRGKASDILIAVQNDYLNGKYNSAQDALDHVAKQIHNATGLPIAQ